MSGKVSICEGVTRFLFPFYGGLVTGVAFLATIAKFQTHHSTISQLVEIGWITFHWLHAVELPLIAILLLASIVSRVRWSVSASVIVAVIWAAQQWWLFPILDKQTQTVINGGTPSDGSTHIIFAGLATVKLVVLVVAGILAVSVYSSGLGSKKTNSG